MNVSCLPCTHDLKVILYNALSGPGSVYGYVCLYRFVCLYVCMCCVCMCVYMHVFSCTCVYVCMHIHTCLCRPSGDVKCPLQLFYTLLFEIGFLIEPGTPRFNWTGWSMSPRPLLIPISSMVGLQVLLSKSFLRSKFRPSCLNGKHFTH